MLRRLIPRRVTAAVATGVLAAGGAVVLSAPAAHAAEVSWTSKCRNLILGDNLNIPPSETKVDITVDPVKPTYKVGDQVTVKWKWLSYANVPDTGYVDRVAADSTLPKGLVTISGAQTDEVSVQGERKNPETLVGQPLVVSDMQGTFTLTHEGLVDITPKSYATFTMAFGMDAETQCAPLAPSVPPKALSLTVEPGQVVLPEIQAPTGVVRPGAEIALTGTRFAPGATPTVALCRADGTDCQSTRFASNTLAINAGGDLSGSAKLAYPLTDGTWVVRVSDGAKSATAPITVQNKLAGTRTMTLSASSGPVGTKVTVTGAEFTPNRGITVAALNEGNSPLTFVQLVTSPEGTFTTQLPVTDPATVKIRAREGISNATAVFLPFQVTPGGVGEQSVHVALAPGGLTMSQAGTGVDFGTATLNGTAQTLTAALNQVTVVDARGGDAGWSLVGSMSDLTAANGAGTIPAGNIAWTPACAKSASSLSEVITGTAGPLGSAASTLCSQAPSTGGAGGGRFTADAGLTLTTPEFAPAGSYTGTLTLTLS